MTTMTATTLRRAAILLVLVHTGACAQPAEQAPSASRSSGAEPAGTTLQAFLKRHEKRLLASDSDGDGKISRAEFLANAKGGRDDPAKRFAKLDRNGDGMLDTAEIDAMLTRRFKRLDADGSGVIGADERAAARAGKADAAGDGS